MTYKVVDKFTQVVGIARRSTDETKQQDSIEAQRNAIDCVCDSYPLNLDKSFAIDGIIERDGSGLTVERSDLDAAIKHCRANKITAILVAELSRFSREDTQDAVGRIETLQNAGVDLLICNRMPRLYDLSDYEDREEILNELKYAHMYSRNQAETVINRKRSRADRMVMPPPQSFGFTVERDKETDKDTWWLVPDKEKLNIIRTAGLMFIDGKSGCEITSHFNDSGYLTDKGKAWTYQTIKRVLENRIYSGDYVAFKWKSGRLKTAGKGYMSENYTGTRKKGSDRVYKLRMEEQPEENWSITLCEDQTEETVFIKKYVSSVFDNDLSADVYVETMRLVPRTEAGAKPVIKNSTIPVKVFSRDEQKAIATRILSKKGTRVTTREKTKHLFTGFLKCGHCGGPMIGRYSTTKEKYIYYFCYTQRNATISKRKNMHRCCTGGGKTIRESVLLKEVFYPYYQTCLEFPEKVLNSCKEKMKEMWYSDKFIDKKIQVENLTRHKLNLKRDGKDDSFEYKQTVEDINSIEKEMENMPLRLAKDIRRYDGDEMSMTSAISAAVIDDDSKRLRATAIELITSVDDLIPTRDFVGDVLDSAVAHWHLQDVETGRQTRNALAKLEFRYRLGFDATAFLSKRAFAEHQDVQKP